MDYNTLLTFTLISRLFPWSLRLCNCRRRTMPALYTAMKYLCSLRWAYSPGLLWIGLPWWTYERLWHSSFWRRSREIFYRLYERSVAWLLWMEVCLWSTWRICKKCRVRSRRNCWLNFSLLFLQSFLSMALYSCISLYHWPIRDFSYEKNVSDLIPPVQESV